MVKNARTDNEKVRSIRSVVLTRELRGRSWSEPGTSPLGEWKLSSESQITARDGTADRTGYAEPPAVCPGQVEQSPREIVNRLRKVRKVLDRCSLNGQLTKTREPAQWSLCRKRNIIFRVHQIQSLDRMDVPFYFSRKFSLMICFPCNGERRSVSGEAAECFS